MPIPFSCSECEKQLRVKDELAGKRIKCPECAAVVLVPNPNVRAATSEDKRQEPRGRFTNDRTQTSAQSSAPQ